MKKIEDALPYGSNYILDEDKVWANAKFIANGREYDVEVKVRGDIQVHWAYPKKSWRVKFPRENLFNGMRVTNLIIPEDREWMGEPLDSYRAKKFGLPQPPMQFVKVSFNGSKPLLYLEIEHWTKEMLEKQGLSGDMNLYSANDDPEFLYPSYWKKYRESSATQYDSYEEVELLKSLAKTGAHEEADFKGKVTTLFDLDQLIASYAQSILAGSHHTTGDNLRIAFDPSRGRFVPIPWDINLFEPQSLSADYHKLWKEVFSIPEWKLMAYQFLWDYISSEEEMADDEVELKRLRALIERAAYRDPMKIMSNRLVKNGLERCENLFEKNLQFVEDELSNSRVLINQHLPTEDDQKNGILLTFDILNQGVTPIRLTEIHLPNHFRDVRDSLELSPETGELMELSLRPEPDNQGRVVLDVEGDELIEESRIFFLKTKRRDISLDDVPLPLKLELRNAVTGKKTDIVGNVLMDERTFSDLDKAYEDRDSFLRRERAFIASGASGVLLRGTHTFSKTIIIPSGVHLEIAPGTTLWMGSGASLLSYSPIHAVGTPWYPIRIKKAGTNPWGVFAVLNADGNSQIQHAEFSGGSEAFINGAFFSGMVAFHASKVSISDSKFRDAHGDDALNIKYVPSDLTRLKFENNSADGIDIDAAPSGILEDIRITTNENAAGEGGDGVDLSWSNVTIRNVDVEGSKDKCISIGEKSEPVIQDVSLKGCNMGIAVKDGANATIERAEIIDNEIGIATYIKKPFFPPPKVEVNQSTFKGNKKDVEESDGAAITLNP